LLPGPSRLILSDFNRAGIWKRRQRKRERAEVTIVQIRQVDYSSNSTTCSCMQQSKIREVVGSTKPYWRTDVHSTCSGHARGSQGSTTTGNYKLVGRTGHVYNTGYLRKIYRTAAVSFSTRSVSGFSNVVLSTYLLGFTCLPVATCRL
jgi:hypothetical protein